MKHTSFLVLIILMLSCGNHSDGLDDYLHSEKGIILSCIRCGCMEDLLAEYVRNYGFLEIPVYTDTNCIERQSILKRAIQLSQSKLDSFYKDNYNIILFRKVEGRMIVRVVNTNEVLSFKKIREAFFLSFKPEH